MIKLKISVTFKISVFHLYRPQLHNLDTRRPQLRSRSPVERGGSKSSAIFFARRFESGLICPKVNAVGKTKRVTGQHLAWEGIDDWSTRHHEEHYRTMKDIGSHSGNVWGTDLRIKKTTSLKTYYGFRNTWNSRKLTARSQQSSICRKWNENEMKMSTIKGDVRRCIRFTCQSWHKQNEGEYKR